MDCLFWYETFIIIKNYANNVLNGIRFYNLKKNYYSLSLRLLKVLL